MQSSQTLATTRVASGINLLNPAVTVSIPLLAQAATQWKTIVRSNLPRRSPPWWRLARSVQWGLGGYSPVVTNHQSHDLRALPAPRDGMPFAGEMCLGPYSTGILSQDQ
jgi:hypothetical protein